VVLDRMILVLISTPSWWKLIAIKRGNSWPGRYYSRTPAVQSPTDGVCVI